MSTPTSNTCASADFVMASSPAGTEVARPRVVLVGPPGSGKTSVGRALALRWAVEFRDTDQDIERLAGMSVADIFVEMGEPYFRERERSAVEAALRDHDGVLALGGGSVTDGPTRELLHKARVVFLDVGLAAAMSRLEMNRSRPLLLGNVRSTWQTLEAARRPLYEEVADQVVSTDQRTVDDLATEIAEFWKERS